MQGLAAWASVLVALAVPFIAYWLNRKLNVIHVLVNRRLMVALAAIASLKRDLGLALAPEEAEAEESLSREAADRRRAAPPPLPPAPPQGP